MKSRLRTFIIRLSFRLFSLAVSGVFIRGMLLVFFPEQETLSNAVALAILVLNMVGQYQIAWKTGERDRNLVKFNHLTYQPRRGFVAGAFAFVPTLAGLIFMQVFAPLFIYIVYIAVIALTPLLTGIGYLNGHKLKSYGISIMYRKKR